MNDHDLGLNSTNPNHFDSQVGFKMQGSIKLKKANPKISSISYINTEDSSKFHCFSHLSSAMKGDMTPLFAKLVLSPPNSNKNSDSLKKSKIMMHHVANNQLGDTWDKLIINTGPSRSPNRGMKHSKITNSHFYNEIQKILPPPTDMVIEEEIDSYALRRENHLKHISENHYQNNNANEHKNSRIHSAIQLDTTSTHGKLDHRSHSKSKKSNFAEKSRNKLHYATQKAPHKTMPEILEKIEKEALALEFKAMQGGVQVISNEHEQPKCKSKSSNLPSNHPEPKISEFYSPGLQNQKIVDFPYMPRKPKRSKPFFFCCG